MLIRKHCSGSGFSPTTLSCPHLPLPGFTSRLVSGAIPPKKDLMEHISLHAGILGTLAEIAWGIIIAAVIDAIRERYAR
jgi:hypothetical protein